MIYYLAEYSVNDPERNLSGSPAGIAKMNYMISLFCELGKNIVVCSSSRTRNKHGRFAQKTVKQERGETIWFRPTFGTDALWKFYLERWYGVGTLVWFFLKNVRKKDTVLVYHEVYYLPWVHLLHKLIGFRLIYEVEELYGYGANSESLKQKECKYLKHADGFIYTTKLLNEKINQDGRPFMVIHGAYQADETTEVEKLRDRDHKCHCLYSGTLSAQKGGAYLAIEAAEFLNAGYCMHITGMGSEKETSEVQAAIASVKDKTQCEIRFEGFLPDEAYQALMRGCDIGLSTQNAEAVFNDVCFQSKTLMYLSHGLHVVTADMKVMRESDIGDCLHYYSENTPSSVAETIKAVRITADFDGKKKIRSLHTRVLEELSELITN